MIQKMYDCELDFIDRKIELLIISDILHCKGSELYNFDKNIDHVLANWLTDAREKLEEQFDAAFVLVRAAQKYLDKEGGNE